jgi:hypothetical protein
MLFREIVIVYSHKMGIKDLNIFCRQNWELFGVNQVNGIYSNHCAFGGSTRSRLTQSTLI